MASREAFLPVSTEEDVEKHAAPQVPNYNPNPSQSGVSTITGTFVEHLNVDVTGRDDAFPNTSGQHMMCCNCCCDFRRAVLIANGIAILIKLLAMMGVALVAGYVKKNLDDIERDLDDDETRKAVDGFVKGGMMGLFELIVEIIEFVSIGLYACGIYGALKFKEWGIITAGCAYGFQLLIGIISLDFGNIIVTSLFLYPHYFFFEADARGNHDRIQLPQVCELLR